MSHETEIDALESEWSPDGGLFWRIRDGRFDPSDFERTLKRISAIAVTEKTVLPRRFVSLLWYIPLFMQWQVERVRENDGDVAAYTNAIAAMTNEIERILGMP